MFDKMKGRPVYSLLSCLLGNRIASWLVGLVVMATILTLLNAYVIYSFQSWSGAMSTEENGMEVPHARGVTSLRPLTVWIYHNTERPLNHVITTFSRMGYVEGGPDDWDVMWSHHYPFKSLSSSLGAHLHPHQRMNHFPGSGCFTSKPQLATLPLPYIPPAFKLPQQAEQLRAQAAEHPEKLWVQKNNLHRGILVKPIEKVNFDAEGKFVQEFISNPLLIGGRKFDIGIYTVISSIDPLRVYTYQEEILLRFCSKDYNPFKAADPKKYVVDDEYTPSWEIPELVDLVDKQQFSNKHILNIVLRKQGHDPGRVWEQVYQIIPEILQRCHANLIRVTDKFTSSPRHFFELVRFDFVIDNNLKVWLMEVNLSPNLSSGHTHRNRFMYEQIMFNLLALVGVARRGGDSSRYNGEYESVVVVNDRDIQLPLDLCWNGTCSNCNAQLQCHLCSACRTPAQSFMLKMAFLEHVERRNFRRVVPPPLPHPPPLSVSSSYSTLPSDQLMYMWFAGKCQEDVRWCN